jgi:hypothetical protein
VGIDGGGGFRVGQHLCLCDQGLGLEEAEWEKEQYAVFRHRGDETVKAG